MSVASRPVATGKTRTCPHCKATILESLSICPGCMHHLRFDSEAAKRQVSAAPALRVEGMIRHPPLEQAMEYFVIIAIRNDRGEEITRQVVNVGALQAAEKRTFTLSVEVLPPQAPPTTKSNLPTAALKTPAQATATASPTTAGSPATAVNATTAANPVTAASPAGPANTGGTAGAASAAATTRPTSSAGSPATAPTPDAAKKAPTSSASTSTPSGYPGGLKPPVPGGPKRH